MKTLGEVLTLSAQYLKDRKVTRARRIAEELLAHHLELKRLDLYMQFDRPMLETELAAYRASLKRKIAGEPLEYILGKIPFFHCQIEVSPAVLIPRPETEILLSKAAQAVTPEMKTAWDVCCGSGCLGLGLKKAHPHLEVTLSDLSPDALEVAKKNGALNELDVKCVQGDFLAPFAGKKADLILCNPPYVTDGEYDALDPEVKNFEPKMALVGGLSFYQRLSQELPNYLNPGAKVFLEIGSKQGDAVLSLFSAPCWTVKRVEKDWADHDRFFFLEFESLFTLS